MKGCASGMDKLVKLFVNVKNFRMIKYATIYRMLVIGQGQNV